MYHERRDAGVLFFRSKEAEVLSTQARQKT